MRIKVCHRRNSFSCWDCTRSACVYISTNVHTVVTCRYCTNIQYVGLVASLQRTTPGCTFRRYSYIPIPVQYLVQYHLSVTPTTTPTQLVGVLNCYSAATRLLLSTVRVHVSTSLHRTPLTAYRSCSYSATWR